MIYLIYISLGYLLVNSVILLMNRYDFTPPLPAEDTGSDPLVSICIPARNEEGVIERAVRSALHQDYQNVEVIVLDDESTDATLQILEQLREEFREKLYIIRGKDKPSGWIGKNWACHQLSVKASGKLLFFMDADAWLEPAAVSRIVRSAKEHKVDFITVWPLQKLGSFWEKAVIPVIYYGLFTLLPARYVHNPPGWLPSRYSASFAAACGQCMVFRRDAYQAIGGHRAVKEQIVEDVALAKQVKKNGLQMRMYHGEGTIQCRMYRSHKEMWEGFRKNFLALYNNSVLLFTFMAALNFVVYVLPFLIFSGAIWVSNMPAALLSAAAISVIVIHRVILARWYRWSVGFSVTHPLGVLWFLGLGVRVLTDYAKGIPPRWKNRPMPGSQAE